MKSATIPSLRVSPALRASAESVLQEGETLSSFVEHAIKITIEQRQAQSEFIARGLRSRDDAHASGRYTSADKVVARLERMLEKAKAKK
jgi:ribosome-associated translation inhibitor RaiA